MASPMFSCETSTVIRSGKSRGKHSIASARKFCSSNPPKFFTPLAVPTGFQRHFGLNLLVHGDGVKIDVQHVAVDR